MYLVYFIDFMYIDLLEMLCTKNNGLNSSNYIKRIIT